MLSQEYNDTMLITYLAALTKGAAFVDDLSKKFNLVSQESKRYFDLVICFVLFCFVLFCFVLFCFVLFWFGLVWFGLVWFGLVWFVLFCFLNPFLCFRYSKGRFGQMHF